MDKNLCECGCGQVTNVAPFTIKKKGLKKGDHFRFIVGHNTRFKEQSGEKTLTQERLKKRLHYDPDSGEFRWRIKNNIAKSAGQIAGHFRGNGYVLIGLFGKLEYAHRLAWLYIHGYIPEGFMDHIDRNKKNNRIANLREVSQTCNARNSGLACTNKTGVRGVSWNKKEKKWQAFIKVKRKSYRVGGYNDFDEAVCARLAAEQCLDWAGCDSSSTAFQHVSRIQKSCRAWENYKPKGDK